MQTVVDQLIANYKLISDQIDESSIKVILENLHRVLDNRIEGEIVEFGSYKGTTSLFLTRLLNKLSSNKKLHIYDSFEGLPDKSIQDASLIGDGFKSGELKASKKDLIKEFNKAGLAKPVIHKGWFNELRPKDVPTHIAFAFLDGDFYESIHTSLKLVWPRLNPGGIICIDDYKRDALPGVERAVQDFFGSDEKITKIANIGVLAKSLTRIKL
jgi:O-methyltransferase